MAEIHAGEADAQMADIFRDPSPTEALIEHLLLGTPQIGEWREERGQLKISDKTGGAVVTSRRPSSGLSLRAEVPQAQM